MGTPSSSTKAEYTAIQNATGLVELGSEESWEVTGVARQDFLNAYSTQDIKNLTDNQTAPATFLTQKGKIVSNAHILPLPDKYLLILPKGFGQKLTEHLATFLLLVDAEIQEVTKEWGHLALLGPKAKPILEQVLQTSLKDDPTSLQTAAFQSKSLLIFPSKRLGSAGWEILSPQGVHAAFKNALLKMGEKEGLRTLSQEVLEMIRVEAGLPKMGIDMGEANLVAEVGLDKEATSFTKGCYLGQETTARVQTQGHVNKHLRRVKLAKPYGGDLPVAVFQGEREVGKITSLVESLKFQAPVGLGVLQRKAVESNEPLFLKEEDEKITLTPL